MIDALVQEYRITKEHAATVLRVGLYYGFHEAMIYDLNASFCPVYRREVKELIQYDRKRNTR